MLRFCMLLVALLVLVHGHPHELESLNVDANGETLDSANSVLAVDADAQQTRVRRGFGGYGGFPRFGGGGCCGGGYGGYPRYGGYGGYPGGGYGGYPGFGGGGFGGGFARASASASAGGFGFGK